MSRLKALVIAGCMVLVGFDSSRVPGVDPIVWPIIYILIAIGIVHTSYKPDKYKLRMVVAMVAAAGVIRGFLYLVHDHRVGPMAFQIAFATLAVGYWEIRGKQLPERVHETS